MNDKKPDESTVDEILSEENSAADHDSRDASSAAEKRSSSSRGPNSDVDDLRLQLQEAQDRFLRTQADIDNFRKRARRETEEAVKYAVMPLVRDLLPAIDNLQRAVESQKAEAPAAGLLEGVQMVSNQLLEVLSQHHCRPISAEGESFDPMYHEAVLYQPSDLPEGQVVQETQTGYRLHDRVIRPSQVIVSKGPSETKQ